MFKRIRRELRRRWWIGNPAPAGPPEFPWLPDPLAYYHGTGWRLRLVRGWTDLTNRLSGRIAWRLPRRLVYWCALRYEVSHARESWKITGATPNALDLLADQRRQARPAVP